MENLDLELNYKNVSIFISKFIEEELKSAGFKRAVIGISGGLDSSIVAYLTVKALGKENVYGVFLPYKTTLSKSREDALKIFELLSINKIEKDITTIADSYFEGEKEIDNLRKGNFLARIRMSILFDLSKKFDALVVGTSNKSEILVGYTTWYGDSAASIQPIGDLYKTQVRGLAKHLNVPLNIINKAPTADLWEGQTDEAEIGITYEELDKILYLAVDERLSLEAIEEYGFKKETIIKILNKIKNSQFKRLMPPIAKISQRSVGIDFLYPRDWGK